MHLIMKFYRFILLPKDLFSDYLNRKACMSTHILLNLLNQLRKIDKIQGLPSILSLFRNDFNKFNNTGA